jgi:hypothetical protein
LQRPCQDGLRRTRALMHQMLPYPFLDFRCQPNFHALIIDVNHRARKTSKRKNDAPGLPACWHIFPASKGIIQLTRPGLPSPHSLRSLTLPSPGASALPWRERAEACLAGFQVQRKSWLLSGRERMRLPVILKIALHTAGIIVGTLGSPMPPHLSPPLRARCVSTSGMALRRSIW